MKAYFCYLYRLLVFLSFYLCVFSVSGQEIKTISGRIINKTTNKPFNVNDAAVEIYAFNTVAEAEDFKKVLSSESINTHFMGIKEIADENGYYEIKVAENGALLFKAGVTSDPVMEKVNFRLEINMVIEGGLILDEAIARGFGTPKIEPIPPQIVGNRIYMENNIPLRPQEGRRNGRLIIQPYIIDCISGDTVQYLRPWVYDGEQYHLTQERRMNYQTQLDPLFRYVKSGVSLTEAPMVIKWADTAILTDPTRNYYANTVIQLEDYNSVYSTKTTKIITCNARRPLKFLEYSLGQYQLDPEKFRERPQRERRNTAGNISLTFLVGKAQLDPENPDNELQIDKLKEDLLAIVKGEGSTLKEFHITGIASPEGSYRSNLALAQQRVKFAQQQVTSVLPRRVLARVYQNPQAQVASWDAVADLLEADSLMKEASGIRTIVREFSGHDAQYARISRLPYYQKVIKAYLPRLRTVRYEYKHEIYRELTAAEILDKYENDPGYRSGKKKFALYEYWHLFQLVKDPEQLEVLYKRAYEDSKEVNGRPWVLAANNLAVSYLRKNKADTSILAPFIDRRFRKVDLPQKPANILINPEAVVANQLAMYLQANNYEQAGIMAQILPDNEKNAKLKAFALCLNGYYQGGRNEEELEQSRRIFNLVKSSSPVNEVVMWLALNNKMGNAKAEIAAGRLPEDNPVTWYLRAIIFHRKGDEALDQAKFALIRCFQLDEKYIFTAETDGDIGEELFEITMDAYQMMKELKQR